VIARQVAATQALDVGARNYVSDDTLNTYRLAGKANIAHARRDLHDRADAFAVYGL